MANGWFSSWERDRVGNWGVMGWLWTSYAAAQFMATHLVQCRVALQEPILRYMIGDKRGDGVIPQMR